MDVGSEIILQQETWSFADSLSHFDQHILQSIPCCQEQREYIAALARFFLHSGARAYEIGVSTGALAEAVLARLPERSFDYIGLDLEPEMVTRARTRLAQDPRFTACQAEATAFRFQPAQLVIAYYTLQFIPLPARQQLLQRIYATLNPGGALILYEKTLGGNARVQDMLTQLYFDFKAEQGLSPVAILNKAISLRGLSQPISLEQNTQQLQQAGFSEIELIFRAHCFAGFLALKPPTTER
jgi:tRNA (cmo5U34)-methyltransferase